MTEATMDILKRRLKHPRPEQLWAQFVEIVEARTYLQHGIEVHPGDVVLDVGANVGVAAAFFATECDAGVVHSFEPIPEIFEQLQRNLVDFPACVPHPYGLSSSAGRGQITFYPKIWAMSGAYADPEADEANLRRVLLNHGASDQDADAGVRGQFQSELVDCELRTVSDVIRDEGIDRVGLLKIDAEKAELDVLGGIEPEDWPRIRQLVGELHLDSAGRAGFSAELEGHGFDVTVVQEPMMEGTPVHLFYASRRPTLSS